MFEHLDDPTPPSPGPTLAERLRAEGGRRRRRRSRAIGGGVVGVALVAVAAMQPWDAGDRRVEVGPSDTTSTAPSTSTTDHPDATTTTTEVPPTADAFPTNTFAAVTRDLRVVLVDLDSGEIVVELDHFDDEHSGGSFVARAPDGSAVYAGGFNQGLWRYAPGAQPVRLSSAADVSVSPDGARLAVVSADGPDSQGTIWILDSVSGSMLDELSVRDLTGEGDRSVWKTQWDPSGDLLYVNANLPEQGGEVFVVAPGGELRRLGPPSGLPSGSGWYLGGPAGDGDVWVLESCCALDANSYDGGSSLVRIDAASGDVLDRQPLDVPNQYHLLDAGPPATGFLLLAPAYPFSEGEGGIFVGTPEGTIEARQWPAFAAVDW